MTCRYAANHFKIRYITIDDCIRSDHGAFTDSHAFKDDCAGCDPSAITNEDWRVYESGVANG